MQIVYHNEIVKTEQVILFKFRQNNWAARHKFVSILAECEVLVLASKC